MPDEQMNEIPADDAAPVEWKENIPNDRFCYFHTGSTTLILKTLDAHLLDRNNRFSTEKLYIYAETIKIVEDVHFPGKELGLFCNKLELGADSIVVSVSGDKGVDGSPNKTVSSEGADAGKIILYVEDFDDKLSPSFDKKGLFLHANGGDGGGGAINMGDGNPRGGNGGNGGNGGSIHVYFGHSLLDLSAKWSPLISSKTERWSAKVQQFKGVDFKDKVVNDDVSSAIAKYNAEVSRLAEIKEILDFFSFNSAPKEVTSADNRTKLSKAIAAFSSLPQEPRVTDAEAMAIGEGFDIINTLRKASDGTVTEDQWRQYNDRTAALTKALGDAVANPWKDGEGPVGKSLYSAINSLEDQISYIVDDMTTFYKVNGGRAGQGGAGATASSPHGSAGKAGANGDLVIKMLRFSGFDEDLAIPHVIAHPDQCQMLLNIADLKYYTASGGSTTKTANKGSVFKPGQMQTPKEFAEIQRYYERLQKRLRFMVPLRKQLVDVDDLAKTEASTLTQFALFISYGIMEEKEKLVLNAIPQLLQISTAAAQRLDWVATGRDFMGHRGDWVPRLNYSYYSEQLKGYLADAVSLAQDFAKIQDKTKLSVDIVRSALVRNKAMLDSLDSRIRLITGPSNAAPDSCQGDLAAAASQIKAFTPLLQAKRKNLGDRIVKAKVKIAKHINTDPRIFLDAFAMIAFAPCPLNIGAQSAGAVFKAGTTVTGTDGQQVEKSYVVSQFGTAGTTLDHLEESYKSTSNGTLDVDDPGAAKLLTTKADLDKLLENFKDALGNNYAVLKFDLQEYLSFIQTRNAAVMSYNASVQQLMKAYADKRYYEAKGDKLGQVLLSMDPRAPALRLFLTKSLNDLRANILAALYRGERALQFWGLGDDMEPIPLAEDYTDIQLLQQRDKDFKTAFENMINEHARNPGSIFPDPGNKKACGKCYYLPQDDVASGIQSFEEELVQSEDPSIPAAVTYKKYQFSFRVPTVRQSTTKTASDFSYRADVRIDQVRAWLFGASVDPGANGNRDLTVMLRHFGNDNIVRARDNRLYEFNHDSVLLTFTYDPETAKTFQETPTANTSDHQKLPSFRDSMVNRENESMAPFGPFADWQLTVSEKHNIGLKLAPDTKICVEFWGESRSFPT